MLFLITGNFLYGTGWHKAMRCVIMWCMWRVQRALHAAGGVWGVLYQEFFCKYKPWEGRFGAILKAPEKKKAKKGFSQELRKKGVCLPKKVKKGLKGFPGRPVNNKLWDERTHPFPNLNFNLKLKHACKEGPRTMDRKIPSKWTLFLRGFLLRWTRAACQWCPSNPTPGKHTVVRRMPCGTPLSTHYSTELIIWWRLLGLISWYSLTLVSSLQVIWGACKPQRRRRESIQVGFQYTNPCHWYRIPQAWVIMVIIGLGLGHAQWRSIISSDIG